MSDNVMAFDIYNMQANLKVFKTLNAIRSDADHVPIVCLNDQGGSVMDVSSDIVATLRAQDHGHPSVVCFEPGIMSRDDSASNRAYINVCSTLRAQMGDNQPAVCYQQNQREECRCLGEKTGAIVSDSGIHNTNYICYALDHVITTGANCTAQGPCVYKDICPTEKAGGVHAVCYEVKDGR